MYHVYDIVLNDDNKIDIVFYKVNLVNVGKKSYYEFVHVNTMTVEDYDLPVIMENVVNISGMVSMTKFRASNFNCMAEGFTNTIRSLYFPLYYSLLEKSFCEDVIDGVCHIITYATFVDVRTGEIKTIKIKDLGMTNEEKVEDLLAHGFKDINNSYLRKFIWAIDTNLTKPISLTRLKKD